LFNGIAEFLYTVVEKLQGFISNIGITDIGVSYVLSVLLLTLIIRLLILPLNIKSMKSTAKMQEIQPELKKIQTKYKNNPEKLQQETVKLYKENNVSMTGGCLPMIIQMPILFALYGAFMKITAVEGQSFLWIVDLSKKDPSFILPVLAAALTYLSTVYSTKANSASASQAPGTPNMGSMNIAMSVMIGVSAINFRSLLVLYWIMGSVIQIIQTYVIVTLPKKRKEKQAQIS
jgi:YidC/Oxa1 family membrane protein insertase